MKIEVLFHLLCLTIRVTQQNDDFYQDAFVATVQHLEMSWYNKTFADPVSLISDKYNRTITTTSFFLNLKIPVFATKIQLKVYKFLDMDFKFTGIQMTVDGCNCLKHNYYGGAIAKKIGNVTDCPLAPGNYGIVNALLDSTRLPPLIPGGLYKGEGILYANNLKEPIATAFGVVSIVYPVKRRRAKNKSKFISPKL